MHLKLMMKILKISMCNQMDLETLESQPLCSDLSPDTDRESLGCVLWTSQQAYVYYHISFVFFNFKLQLLSLE